MAEITDPLAVKLAQIWNRAKLAYASPKACYESQQDNGPLLAFAAGALDLAGRWDAEVTRLDELAALKKDDGERLAVSMRAQAYSDCASELRETVARALLGEGQNAGQD